MAVADIMFGGRTPHPYHTRRGMVSRSNDGDPHGKPGRDNRLPARLAPEPRGTYKIAIGLTGDPVPVGSRSGAIMHRNDQRRISAHTCLSSVNCK